MGLPRQVWAIVCYAASYFVRTYNLASFAIHQLTSDIVVQRASLVVTLIVFGLQSGRARTLQISWTSMASRSCLEFDILVHGS